MKSVSWLFLAVLAVWAGSAAPAGAVSAVASTQDLAWLTKAIGGNRVSVDYLCGSNDDPHRVDPRPSQALKLSRADMLVRIGMDLDLWVDSLIKASGNGKISLVGKGYVDCSQGINKLEVPTTKLDPSKGDIHIFGNPHYFSGPLSLP